MRCFYHPDYFFALPAGHPFPMEKFPEAHALVRGQPGIEVVAPPPLARATVERVHHPAYLRRVDADDVLGQVGLTSGERVRLGLPGRPGLLARSMLEAAGTLGATRAALEDGIAANLAGGTHHAFPARGMGFCVLNDVAIAVAALRAEGCDLASILVVDTDAHQGNANHAWFRGDKGVFTFSIHVGRNYPAKKEPGDCDVPLPRHVGGADYLEALAAHLPAVFARLEPDLVFWISGADCHRDDRFGQMALSTAEMAERDRLVIDLCRTYAAPTVVVYGGGYNRTSGKTAQLHGQSVLLAAEVPLRRTG
ncbi:MAG: histone deacetylase [Opitutales bacterium]